MATFVRFFRSGRPPQRADRAAAGTLPTRAYRYCEAVTSAAAFGWYVFPPIRFELLWDGSDVTWTFDGAGSWFPLGAAQFPDFAAQFDATVPPDLAGFSPPFLAALIEPGLVQIWTGLAIRTEPGWSTLVRGPANFVRNPGFECYEGIIETDRWFGPLFFNIRLTRTHHPISFDPDTPFMQVQPVPREAYSSRSDDLRIRDFGELAAEDWDDYRRTVVAPNIDPDRRRGQYALEVRKRGD